MDPATRKLALIAAGIGGALLVVVGGWTMLNHRSHGVPVVQAESSPMRVKPANPGGMQVAGANNDIFSGGNDTDVEKLAPPPQTPDPQALRAPPAPTPASGVLTRGPVAAPPATNPVATPPALGSVATPPGREQTAIAGIQPPAQPAPGAAARAPVAAVVPPARSAEKPVPAPTASAHTAGSRDVLVQLAALSSEPAAKAEWERLARRWPDLIGGHRPAFSKIERDGQTFWRVRTGGFDGVAQATIFCERLRAKGGGCSVADF